jgi:hypothetical protein
MFLVKPTDAPCQIPRDSGGTARQFQGSVPCSSVETLHSRSGAAAVVFRRLGGMVKGNGHCQRAPLQFNKVAAIPQPVFIWLMDRICASSALPEAITAP